MVVMRKIVEMFKKCFFKVFEIIIKNLYMDDIIESVYNMKSVKKFIIKIEDFFKEGGF